MIGTFDAEVVQYGIPFASAAGFSAVFWLMPLVMLS